MDGIKFGAIGYYTAYLTINVIDAGDKFLD